MEWGGLVAVLKSDLRVLSLSRCPVPICGSRGLFWDVPIFSHARGGAEKINVFTAFPRLCGEQIFSRQAMVVRSCVKAGIILSMYVAGGGF